MRRGKKTIRLTESEMVSMIERIVNEVKREKRNQISESRYNRRRYLMEAEEAAMDIEAELAGVDIPTPEMIKKIEDFITDFPDNVKKLSREVRQKINKFFKKSPDLLKKFVNINKAIANKILPGNIRVGESRS